MEETVETEKFVLMSNEGYLMKEGTLKEIWKYTKAYVNEPRNHIVNQEKHGVVVNTVCAYYLVENFKTENSLLDFDADMKLLKNFKGNFQI